MITKLINEINKSLTSGCYMSALMVTLTLPDICGKAEYPNANKQKERYTKWFNEYIGKYEHSSLSPEEMPKLNGELVYCLRCAVLHEGNPNTKGKNNDISYFELIWEEQEGSAICTGYSMIHREYNKYNEWQIIEKKMSINIRDLCNKICTSAQYYYDKNQDKFNFFDYNIVNMSFHTKEMFFKKQ